jgi:hypothetical protein
MRQQINLYQPAFYEQRTQLSARTAVSALGVVCAALLFWRIYSGRQVTQLTREVETVRAQQQRQSELAAVTEAARTMRGNPVRLQAQAQQLAAQLKQRQRALEFLHNGSTDPTRGFADRLEALARQRVDGVWLDHIVLGDTAGISSLAGYTLDPNLVPRYFQALAGEPALRGTRFDVFRIGEPPNLDARSAGATDSPSAGDTADATNSKAPQTAPGATRFRAFNAAPPKLQARSIS